LIAASAANQAAALKNVVSKGILSKPWAKALGAQNSYAVVTILALLATLPFVLAFDARDAVAVYNQVIKAGTGADVVKYSLLSGLTFFLYNEASFLALDRLSPVTHSVANTLKRVVIIVASCIVFKTPMSLIGGIGSGIAILVSYYCVIFQLYISIHNTNHINNFTITINRAHFCTLWPRRTTARVEPSTKHSVALVQHVSSTGQYSNIPYSIYT
jgi:hypothetical protein